MALQKFPLQIRLDLDELEALDQYVASFPDFPPTRVAVVHRALREWLAEKTAARSAGPAVPSALELAGHEAASLLLPTDTASPQAPASVQTGLDPETLEELPPEHPDVPPPTGRASDAGTASRRVVTSDEDAQGKPERRSTGKKQRKKRVTR